MTDISPASIAAASPGDTLRDPSIPGLQLRVFPNRKAYYLYYRTRGGKQRRPKLGDYPMMTLATARKNARDMLARVANGEDPSQDWQEERRDGITVAELADEYLERHARRWKKTAGGDEHAINKHIKGRKIGAMRVADVTDEDIERLHDNISKKAPIQANRVLALISKMFQLAEKWGYRPRHSNPCFGVRRNPERKRERYLRPEEGPRVAAALAKEDPVVAATIMLLMFTGARRSEIVARKLNVVDGYIVLTDHKTAAKTGNARRILLPRTMLDVIEDLKLNGKVLPPITRIRSAWDRIRVAADVPDLRLHDLRHSFASVGLSNGVAKEVIQPLLGHASAATTDRYAHLMDHARRQAVETVAEHMGLMLGFVQKEAAE